MPQSGCLKNILEVVFAPDFPLAYFPSLFLFWGGKPWTPESLFPNRGQRNQNPFLQQLYFLKVLP